MGARDQLKRIEQYGDGHKMSERREPNCAEAGLYTVCVGSCFIVIVWFLFVIGSAIIEVAG